MRLQHAALLSALLLPSALQGQQVRPWQSTDYYRLTVVSSPALSPDARRVAFVVTTVVEDKDRRHNEIWMAPADGSAPAFRYTSPSTEASNPNWSPEDRKSTRLNSSHMSISYAVFCLKKKTNPH